MPGPSDTRGRGAQRFSCPRLLDQHAGGPRSSEANKRAQECAGVQDSYLHISPVAESVDSAAHGIRPVGKNRDRAMVAGAVRHHDEVAAGFTATKQVAI